MIQAATGSYCLDSLIPKNPAYFVWNRIFAAKCDNKFVNNGLPIRKEFFSPDENPLYENSFHALRVGCEMPNFSAISVSLILFINRASLYRFGIHLPPFPYFNLAS